MRILYLILVLTLLSSCRKREVPSVSEPAKEKPVEVSFSSGINVAVESSSRVPFEGSTLPVNSEVGVFGILADTSYPEDYTIEQLMNGNAIPQDYLYNEEYVVTSENGDMQQKYIAIYPTKDSGYDGLCFYAYYPHDPEIIYNPSEEGTTYLLPVTLNSNSMEESVDYLYTGQVVQQTPVASQKTVLPFKHALGRLKFAFNTTNDKILSKVTEIHVYANCSPKGVMSIEDGTCVPDNTKASVRYKYNLNEIITGSEPFLTADFMLFPNVRINTIYCFISTEDGEAVRYQLYSYNTSVNKINLEAGQFTKISVNFTPKEVQLTGDVSTWIEQGTDNVNIDEETGEVTHE